MKKLFAIIISCLLFLLPVFGQGVVVRRPIPAAGGGAPTTPPTYVGDAYNQAASSGTIGVNFTVSAGSSRAVVACIAMDSATATVSSGVWNSGSQSFSQIGRITRTNASIEWWRVVAPTQTFASADFTLSTTVANVTLTIIYFTGVDQTTPAENFNTATGTSTGPTVTITSNTGSVVVGAFTWANSPPFSSVGAGQTSVKEFIFNTNVNGNVSYETGSTSTTHSYTLGSSEAWCIAGFSLKGL